MSVLFYNELDFHAPGATDSVTIATIPPGSYGPNPVIYIALAQRQGSAFQATFPTITIGGVIYVNPSMGSNVNYMNGTNGTSGSSTPNQNGWAWMILPYVGPVFGTPPSRPNLDLGVDVVYSPGRQYSDFLSGTITVSRVPVALTGTISSGTPTFGSVPITGVGTRFLYDVPPILYDALDTGSASFPGGGSANTTVLIFSSSLLADTVAFSATQTVGVVGPTVFNRVSLFSNTIPSSSGGTIRTSFDITANNVEFAKNFQVPSRGLYWGLIFTNIDTLGAPATADLQIWTYNAPLLSSSYLIQPSVGTSFAVGGITSHTAMTAQSFPSLGIPAGSTFMRLDPPTGDMVGSGSAFTSELSVGDILHTSQSALSAGYRIASIADDTHATVTPIFSLNEVGVGKRYAKERTDDTNTALIFVFDPEEVIPNLNFTQQALLINQFVTQIPSSIVTTPPGVGGAFETRYDQIGSGDFTAKFAMAMFADYSTDNPPLALPDLVGGKANWSLVGSRVNDRAVVGAALWTRPNLGPPLDFSVNWTVPNGYGAALIFGIYDSAGHPVPRGGLRAVVIG